MRACRALPTVSAHEVARIGAAQVAAAVAARVPELAAGGGAVSLPLVGRALEGGRVELSHAVTGERCGIFASAEVARRTVNFFL